MSLMMKVQRMNWLTIVKFAKMKWKLVTMMLTMMVMMKGLQYMPLLRHHPQ